MFFQPTRVHLHSRSLDKHNLLIRSLPFSFQIDPKVAFPRRTHPKVRDIYMTPALGVLGTREMTIVAFEAAANFTFFTHEKLLWPGSQVLKDKPDCGQEVAKGQTWALKVY